MNKFSFCPDHLESEQEFLLIKEYGLKLYCSQCIYQLQKESSNEELNEIIHLKKIQSYPEEIFYKLFPSEKNQMLEEMCHMQLLSKLLRSRLNQITWFKKTLDFFYEETLISLKEAEEILQQMRSEFSNLISLDQFVLTLSKLTEQEQNNQQSIEKLENSLFKYFKEFQKDKLSIFQELSNQQFTTEPYFNNFLKQQQHQLNLISDFHRDISLKTSALTYQPILVDYNYLLNLVSIVEKKQNQTFLSVKKIFYGSQKQKTLSYRGLQKAISEKSQLLIIFKSISDFVFGVFAAPEWAEINTYLPDNTVTSFIFSYTLKEIYPIRYESRYHAQKFGNQFLSFGGKNNNNADIFISSNFQDGYSQLGVSYEAKGKDSTKWTSYLFGGEKPNITECEVYELL